MLRKKILVKWLIPIALAVFAFSSFMLMWTNKAASTVDFLQGHVYEWTYKEYPDGTKEWYTVPVEGALVKAWDGDSGEDYSDANGFFSMYVDPYDYYYVRAERDGKYTNTEYVYHPSEESQNIELYFPREEP